MSRAHTTLQRLRTLPQLLQFGLVGGTAAATHLGVVWLLVYFTGMAPLGANAIAFLVAFLVSYNGHALLTFSTYGSHGWQTMARFFSVACLSFVANEALYALALRWLSWHYLWSLMAVLVLVAVGTFVLSKIWAFRPSKP